MLWLRGSLVLAAVSVVWSVVVAPARAEVLAREQAVSSIDAYGAFAAWSSFDPARGLYSLRALVGSEVRLLSVAPRPVPFDVDLGPGPEGDVVAVYSRCAKENPRPLSQFRFTRAVGGLGCQIFLYSFANARETRLPVVGGRTSEYTPAIWNDRLTVFQQRGGREAPVELRTRAVGERTRGVRLPVGTPGRAVGPVDVDLRGRRVAFNWQGIERDPCSSDGRSAEFRTEAWTVTVGGQRKRLERVCAEQGAPQLVSATVLPDAVGYLRRGAHELVRVSRDGRSNVTRFNPFALDIAPTAGRTFFFGQTAGGEFEVGVE